jgi:hypothetical protein
MLVGNRQTRRFYSYLNDFGIDPTQQGIRQQQLQPYLRTAVPVPPRIVRAAQGTHTEVYCYLPSLCRQDVARKREKKKVVIN